ncbi:hypothetical protein [uncultured Tateyamaria sp.]|uniref:hypothetical protein n=1 Tax=uncultured Tateyamaria sp. TaxID=455651 RepID=UPI002626036D|nr:hypothetical protein [uncultured Tateyamaria sp.]
MRDNGPNIEVIQRSRAATAPRQMPGEVAFGLWRRIARANVFSPLGLVSNPHVYKRLCEQG